MHGAISPLPQYVFMAWCLVKRRDNFTFTFTLPTSHRGRMGRQSVWTLWPRTSSGQLHSSFCRHSQSGFSCIPVVEKVPSLSMRCFCSLLINACSLYGKFVAVGLFSSRVLWQLHQLLDFIQFPRVKGAILNVLYSFPFSQKSNCPRITNERLAVAYMTRVVHPWLLDELRGLQFLPVKDRKLLKWCVVEPSWTATGCGVQLSPPPHSRYHSPYSATSAFITSQYLPYCVKLRYVTLPMISLPNNLRANCKIYCTRLVLEEIIHSRF
jgi:hypothetical protein